MNSAEMVRQELMREKIKEELAILDNENVTVNGIRLKPSECYRFDLSPNHVLFNTNCPEELKRRVQQIINKHTGYESGA